MFKFAAADIPVYKMEHPAFRALFQKYLAPNVNLPCSAVIRKQLPVIEQEMFPQIKKQLACKKVAILADESNEQHRYFFQILLL